MLFTLSIFFAGLFSFLSPCILPIMPIYLGYLVTEQAGNSKVSLLKSLSFVAGLSLSFFLLGFSAGFLGQLIQSPYFFLAVGIITIILGIHQMGILNIAGLNKEKKVNLEINTKKVGVWSAFLLGFLLSFGWTPCVGPVLASVLAITANNGSQAIVGGSLLLVYSAGLSIPFIIIALFYDKLIHQIKNIYKYFKQIKFFGGLIILLYGVYIAYSQIGIIQMSKTESSTQNSGSQSMQLDNNINSAVYTKKFATLQGDSISLNDFKGKKIYIKFWASWCPICLEGLPELLTFAKEYQDNNDIVVLSVISPKINNEMNAEDFKAWAKSQNVTVNTILDPTGQLLKTFNVRGYPTSVYIDKQGNLQQTKIGHNTKEQILKTLDSL